MRGLRRDRLGAIDESAPVADLADAGERSPDEVLDADFRGAMEEIQGIRKHLDGEACWCGSVRHGGDEHQRAGGEDTGDAARAARAAESGLIKKLESLTPGQRDNIVYYLAGRTGPEIEQALTDLRIVPPPPSAPSATSKHRGGRHARTQP